MPTKSFPDTSNNASGQWSDKPIHHQRHLKVIGIGAGASGLMFAYKLQRSFENFEMTFYEKNADVGGTWFENKYPGCACDIAAHAYVWSFEPNPNWSTTYAGSDEIQEYFARFADKYDIRKYYQFKQMVSRAEWDNRRGYWNIEVTNVETGRVTSDWCHILLNAAGVLNAWKWPSIPGIKEFEGKILHTAKYDRSIDLTGKTVALIGTGSSALQLLPSILPAVKKVISFNRSATYVFPFQGHQQHHYTDEEKRIFASDPKKLQEHRRELDSGINAGYSLFIRDSPMQNATTVRMRAAMANIIKGSGLEDQVIPKYSLGCRRLTPGVGYLEALVDPKTEVVTSGVKAITRRGCWSEEGKHYIVDVIICATGFDTSYIPRFPIFGMNGRPLADAWKHEPKSYFGMAAPGFPNYFMLIGPNSPIGNGPVLIAIEAQVDYILKLVNRYQTENIHSMSPKADAVDEFMAFKDAHMKGTVWGQECRSWYKSGSVGKKVTALWPGSTLHFLETLAEPRYEDWNFDYVGKNRFAYLGNGFSQTELDTTADWSYYLRDKDDSPLLGRAKNRKLATRSGTISPETRGGFKF